VICKSFDLNHFQRSKADSKDNDVK